MNKEYHLKKSANMKTSHGTPPPSRSLPAGVWPVMLTPFLDDGGIDWTGVAALTNWYLASGIAGLFAVCLSSDMYHLSRDEQLALAARVVRHARGRVPVVATGTFGGPIRAQADFVKRMADTGVAAVVVNVNQLAAPRESDAIWRKHMAELLSLTGEIPLGLYECPVPYHRLLTPELLGWAATTGRLLFMKDTCCRHDEIRAKLAAIYGTPVCWCNAHAPTLLLSLRAGGKGYSGVAANFYPELFVWLCAHALEYQAITEAMQRRLTLWDMALRQKYPALACEFLRRRGIMLQSVTREPTPKLDEEDLLVLHCLLEEVNATMTSFSLNALPGDSLASLTEQARRRIL